ncbi:hypothetical protein G3578_06760 [Brevibacillus sp. SYP-B805]|nr:hypothetical protein [Brevibacillus sp. SYP-B805]
MRDVANRYRGLPPRTPEMLFQIIRKFYRGAVSHYALIQERKADALKAWQQYRQTGDASLLADALYTLFSEFHFYVTCWLQIDLALYRLARLEETRRFADVRERFHPAIERHLTVREKIDHIAAALEAQYERFGTEMACVPRDEYWFGDVAFSVNEESLRNLHHLYETIQQERERLL